MPEGLTSLAANNPGTATPADSSDFRYYIHDGRTALSFELASRLSGDSARRLRQIWRTASSMIGDRSLIVALSYVTGVEVVAWQLLLEWLLAIARPTWLPFQLYFRGRALFIFDSRVRSGINPESSRSLMRSSERGNKSSNQFRSKP